MTMTTAAHLPAGTTMTGVHRVAKIVALHRGEMIGGHIAIATITTTVDTVIATATLIDMTAETGATTDDTNTTTDARQLPSRPRTSFSLASTRS